MSDEKKSKGFGTAEAIELAKLGAELLPDVIGLIAGLVQSGHDPKDAVGIAKRDIKSRKAEYERMKAEDHAALLAKHRADDTPADGHVVGDADDA